MRKKFRLKIEKESLIPIDFYRKHGPTPCSNIHILLMVIYKVNNNRSYNF